jgi:ABC-type branched-subunit amino acid transport system ATPase component
MQPGSVVVKGYSFDSLVLPVLLKTKDLEALNFLVKQLCFVVTLTDLQSFAVWAIAENWVQGLKALFSSSAAQIAFQSADQITQHEFLKNILDAVTEVKDVRQKRAISIALVEETLTKRPFNRHLVLILLTEFASEKFDMMKLARECLKSLTGEDLRQLHIGHGHAMEVFERIFLDESKAGIAIMNELAKIVKRY